MPEPLTIDSGNSPLRLQVNGIEFQKASLKLLVNIFSQNLNGVGTDIVDLLASLGFGHRKTPESLAGALIHRSRIRAMWAIIKSNSRELGHLIRTEQSELVDLSQNPIDINGWAIIKAHSIELGHLIRTEQSELVDLSQNPIDINGIEIDREFFNRPEDWEYLKKIESWIKLSLEDLGVDSEKARSMSMKLPDYFATALDKELGVHKDEYELLTRHFADTLCSDACRREKNWRRYRAWLNEQLDEPIFAEEFGIRELYVPLCAYYVEKQDREIRHAYNLESAMNDWLIDINQSCIRLISGGPGSGKSTFTKWWAAQVSNQRDFKVWSIALNDLKFTSGDLENKLKEFARRDLETNPLEEEKILIIFDGLDELSLSGKIGSEAAQFFLDELFALVRYYKNLRVLISGRDAIIHSQINKFDKPDQIWHLLPYYLPEDKQAEYKSYPQNLLEKDKRHDWWEKYNRLKNNICEGLPSSLRDPNLAEITSQPILNYLVAISEYYLQDRIKISTTRNEIYQSLIESVYKRGWAKDVKHPLNADISSEEFKLILEEVGLCAWHGDGRKVSKAEITEHCKDNAKLEHILDRFAGNAENPSQHSITNLMTAFYFREKGRRESDRTFEFTHKSFGEFLTAKRLVRSIEHIDNNCRSDNLSKKSALRHWAEICRSGILDSDILHFIREEIKLRCQEEGGRDLVSNWQKTCGDLISYLLKSGLPMEEFRDLDFYRMNNYAIQTEIALLAVLNACAICTRTLSKIEWKDNQSFGNWLARMQGQRTDGEKSLVTSCLSWLDLQGANLYMVNLQWADLNGANLRGANLNRADLSDANLSCHPMFGRTNLVDAELNGAILVDAKLVNVELNRAKLNGANLDGVDLSGAALDGAKLNKTTFNSTLKNKALLNGAVLIGAELQESKLEGASLKGAKLKYADLTGASLRDAHLDGAELPNCTLNNVCFDNAVLNSTDLREANLEGSSLQEAQLNGANLSKAQLENANLTGVKIEGANFNSAVVNRDTILINLKNWSESTNLRNIQGIEDVEKIDYNFKRECENQNKKQNAR
jgi:uncharacterized protein YjbI with pentapeptide repeats